MKNILCYGDSNTWGAVPESDERYPYDIRWPGVMQKQLGSTYFVIEEGCSGRTTVWEDPIEGEKSGKLYLPACLYSHRPLDLVIIMLGTNDLKPRFSLTAFDIAEGAGMLAKMVLKSECGPKNLSPQILLVSPPPIQEIGRLGYIFAGGRSTSLQLADHFKRVATELGVYFMDTAPLITVSNVDGVHYEASEQIKLGKAMAEGVLQIFG